MTFKIFKKTVEIKPIVINFNFPIPAFIYQHFCRHSMELHKIWDESPNSWVLNFNTRCGKCGKIHKYIYKQYPQDYTYKK